MTNQICHQIAREPIWATYVATGHIAVVDDFDADDVDDNLILVLWGWWQYDDDGVNDDDDDEDDGAGYWSQIRLIGWPTSLETRQFEMSLGKLWNKSVRKKRKNVEILMFDLVKCTT